MSDKAIALKYDNNKSDAPVVVASGKGEIAKRILDIASENKIPIYYDDNLATMLSQLSLGKEIPQDLYKFVVDVYFYLISLNNDEDFSKYLKKTYDNLNEKAK